MRIQNCQLQIKKITFSDSFTFPLPHDLSIRKSGWNKKVIILINLLISSVFCVQIFLTAVNVLNRS
jgi:hypothetical protein